jgi:hypothetical protein
MSSFCQLCASTHFLIGIFHFKMREMQLCTSNQPRLLIDFAQVTLLITSLKSHISDVCIRAVTITAAMGDVNLRVAHGEEAEQIKGRLGRERAMDLAVRFQRNSQDTFFFFCISQS